MPISKTSDFTGYTEGGFSLEDHRRLRNVARMLAARGVHVLLSNSNAPAIQEMYADGFDIRTVRMNRSINSNGKGRGSVEELLIAPAARQVAPSARQSEASVKSRRTA